jgi:transcription elongation GreA/GreB family factor
MTEDKSQTVQMRLKKQTLDHVDNIKKITNSQNRTKIVATSLELTDKLLTKIKQGGKVTIENPDGSKETITIVGM